MSFLKSEFVEPSLQKNKNTHSDAAEWTRTEVGKSQNHMGSSEMVWNFRGEKVFKEQGWPAHAEKFKGHASLYFTSLVFQVDQRCLSLCDWFMGLPDDHIWQGGLCFMSLLYLLFSLGVLTSYLPCLSYPGCSLQPGGERKTLIWGFHGWQNCKMNQRLHRIFMKKMFPRKSLVGV